MRIILLGAAGQLAHDLKSALSKHELIEWTRADVDLADSSAVEAKIREAKPDAVVNSAAYNLVDQAEKDPLAAFAVNCVAPKVVAAACAAVDAVFLHFSTDYVFGLDLREQPWRETDPPGPVSMYGASKLAGEYGVRTHCPRHFVVRTCGLYGVKGSRGKGGNFVETMLRLADSGKPLTIVNDQRCTPSYTADVAAAAARLLETSDYGLYHLTNSGACTWFEFASEIFRQAGKSVDCSPITSAQFNAPARRPAYSVLDCSKLAAAGVAALPDWRDALGRYLAARGR